MQPNHLHTCKQLAGEVTALLFRGAIEFDAIQSVIIFIKDHHRDIYSRATAERGAAVVHRETGKVVKATLGARNERRHRASAQAPCKTYQGLRA